MLLILFSIFKSNSQVGLEQLYDDFIFIENIPKSKEVIRKGLSINSFPHASIKLNEVQFLKALDNKPRAVKNSDEILLMWNYSPWVDILFSTSEGKYEIQLFLGGLGFVTLPNGKKGAVLFDFSKE